MTNYLYIGNSFSLQMVKDVLDNSEWMDCTISVEKVRDPAALVQLVAHNERPIVSCTGHATTAAYYSQVLGITVPHDRRHVSLRGGDTLLVGQVVGGRLEEGTTVLPPGVTVEWMKVRIEPDEE